MDEDLLQFCLKAFVTLIVVVDPLGVAPSLLGIVLAALAVQYVLNGLTGYYDSLVRSQRASSGESKDLPQVKAVALLSP